MRSFLFRQFFLYVSLPKIIDTGRHLLWLLESVTRLFLPRDAVHKHSLCRRAVSVCVSVHLSVCPSRSWICQNE